MEHRRSIIPLALVLAVVAVGSGVVLSAERAITRPESKIGFLIPSQCRPTGSGARPEGPYDAWPAPHTTECALAEGCIASGYGLWVMEEKAFYRLDEAGQERALEHPATSPAHR